MKRTFLIIGLLLGLYFTPVLGVKAEECNSYYKVNVNIEGKGNVVISDSDKKIADDTTLNIKCDDNLLFTTIPDENYVVKGVYNNGNNISSDTNQYGIFNIKNNTNIKIIFGKNTEEQDNIIYYSSSEDNISLLISDLKEELTNDKELNIRLKEVEILFDNEFIKNSNDNITVVANEVYKDDLSVKQKKTVKDCLYYDFYLYNGEDKVDSFKGSATISIPYSKSDKVYVYKVAKDGKISLIDSKYDKEIIKIKVNELGTIAISSEKLDELNYVRGFVNFNNKQIISVIGIGLALCLLAIFIRIKRKK